MNFGFLYAEPNQAAWRFPIAFQLAFALLVMSFIFALPESPRWLVVQGRRTEAPAVLSALYDTQTDHDSLVTGNLQAIDSTIEAEDCTSGTYFAAPFRKDTSQTRTRTLLAISIQIMSQFTGTNAVNFYATSIFQNEIGLSPFLSRILSGGLGSVSFIAAIGPVALISNVGRRRVALLNLASMGLSMIALAISQAIAGYKAGIASVFFVFTFIIFFSLGFAEIPWMYPAEITPLATRVPANALSTATNWVSVFTDVVITPVAFESIGWRTWVVFACCFGVGMGVVYCCFPETRGGGSLVEIEGFFTESDGLFGAVSRARGGQVGEVKRGKGVAEACHVENA